MWYVYILKCNDNSLYTGISTNIEKRLKQHNYGIASKYTRARRPVKLLYREEANTKSEALIRERKIKNYSRKDKEKLVKFGQGVKARSPQDLYRTKCTSVL
jgi:putative endonuclease